MSPILVVRLKPDATSGPADAGAALVRLTPDATTAQLKPDVTIALPTRTLTGFPGVPLVTGNEQPIRVDV